LLPEHGDSAENPVPVAIETLRRLLTACLRATGHMVYPINPTSAARYRDRHSVADRKSDHGDAAVLASVLRTDAHRHRPPPADSELAHAIAVLGRLVDDMAKLSGLVRDRRSALPLVLVGHSLGSFASQQYTLDHSSDIAGVALSGNDGAGRAFSAADRWADSSSVNHKLTRNIAARVTHAFASGPFSVNPVTQRPIVDPELPRRCPGLRLSPGRPRQASCPPSCYCRAEDYGRSWSERMMRQCRATTVAQLAVASVVTPHQRTSVQISPI
jgi:pimeloyl-ACP methyl ester carboxylesterase